MGCTSTSVVYADDPSFVTDVPVFVGDPVTAIYNMVDPTSTQAYCEVLTNTIVNPDGAGTPWSGSAQVAATEGCLSQPCNVFDLVATTNPETIPFKVLTTFDALTHLSV